ncbi:hypothetical protein [Ohtaekwangia sp.]|uniref:hypothetical protein n=1 Tax=Ohtaekwangia sp. TaxID=2066019 RepID=UPI002FDEE662
MSSLNNRKWGKQVPYAARFSNVNSGREFPIPDDQKYITLNPSRESHWQNLGSIVSRLWPD